MDRSGGLLTEYLFGVWIGQADCRPNIHSVYGSVRRIADWISIRCMNRSGGLPTEYSFGVWIGQVDCRPNIHSVYTEVRRITGSVRRIADRIFIRCIQKSGGLPTEYLFGVWIGQVDFRLNIHWCMQGSGELPSRYSFSVWMGQAIIVRIFVRCIHSNSIIHINPYPTHAYLYVCYVSIIGNVSSAVCVRQLHASPNRNLSYLTFVCPSDGQPADNFELKNKAARFLWGLYYWQDVEKMSPYYANGSTI